MELVWKHLDEADIPPGYNFMAQMSPQDGDLKIMWNPNNADEVAAAKAQFDALRKKKFFAYTVDKSGEKGEQILEFDPAAGKTILSLPMAGG